MSKAPRLSPGAARVLDSRVDDIFDRLLTRLLGHGFTGKRLYIGFHEDYSLPGIYHAAVTGEGGRADTYSLEGVAGIAKDYLDKARADAKAKTKHHVGALLRDLHEGRIEHDEFENHVESEMHSVWDSIRSSVERVVETENEHAKTLGIKDGIDQINESLGIDDPVVCFVPVKDDALCDECRRLHLLPDGVTPRVWLSSEVEAGYHKRGVDRPSWNLIHPNCRCALSTILKGFGFDGAGRVTWIAQGHDELAYQRSYKRPPRGEEKRLDKLNRSEDTQRDIVVTIPASKLADVEAEEADVARRLAAGETGITYYWQMGRLPKEMPRRVYFVWNGAVRAFHVAVNMDFGPGRIVLDPTIHEVDPPIPMSGFRGYQYFDGDALRKSEPEFGIPLLKFDVKYADLSRVFKEYGWQDHEGGSHVVWKHSAIPARPVTVKRDHASGSQPIDDDMLRNKYLKQAGLVIQRDGSITPSARHPYAEHYAKLGFEVPGFRGPAVTKTWTPTRAPEGIQHVPIDDLEPGPFEEWQAALHTKNFNLGKGHMVPHVTAVDLGDGRLTVDRGSEVVEAARRAGMTHVPALTSAGL